MSDRHHLFAAHKVLVPRGQTVVLETFGTLDETGQLVEQRVDPPFTMTGGIWIIVIREGELTFWRAHDETMMPVN